MSNTSVSAPCPLVWLITGCTSGFGHIFISAILARGDRVIATARNTASLADYASSENVRLLQLDVTDPQDVLNRKAAAATEYFGRIDVLVNNAGYVLSGVWEEVSHEELIGQLYTNFFGHINVTRAFLPHMRLRQSGTIVFMSSIAGWLGVAAGGPYSASKFALEGAVESLAKEVLPFEVKVHLIELGQFRTNILDGGRRRIARQSPAIDDYNPTAVERILDVVRCEGSMAGVESIPLRVVLGSDAQSIIRNECLDMLGQLDRFSEFSRSTDFPDAAEVKDYK